MAAERRRNRKRHSPRDAAEPRCSKHEGRSLIWTRIPDRAPAFLFFMFGAVPGLEPAYTEPPEKPRVPDESQGRGACQTTWVSPGFAGSRRQGFVLLLYHPPCGNAGSGDAQETASVSPSLVLVHLHPLLTSPALLAGLGDALANDGLGRRRPAFLRRVFM